MKISTIIASLLLYVLAFTSCNTDGEDRLMGSSFGTVVIDGYGTEYIRVDGTRDLLYPENGLPKSIKWKSGDRVLIAFFINSEGKNTDYKYAIEILEIYQIPVQKTLFITTPEAADTLGKDAYFDDNFRHKFHAWVADDYFTTEFSFLGARSQLKKHSFELAKYNFTKSNGKVDTVVLYLKHNARNDTKDETIRHILSFKLNEIKDMYPEKDSVVLSVKVPFIKEKYQEEPKIVTKNFIYKWNWNLK